MLGSTPGNGTHPRMLLGDTKGDVACGCLSCIAPARAKGGTFSMWARAPRDRRLLCDEDPRKKRGTSTTVLPGSKLRRSARRTE